MKKPKLDIVPYAQRRVIAICCGICTRESASLGNPVGYALVIAPLQEAKRKAGWEAVREAEQKAEQRGYRNLK
jgi:hypothetical protein